MAYSQLFVCVCVCVCVSHNGDKRGQDERRMCFTPARWRAVLPVNEPSVVSFTLEASVWCEAHTCWRLRLIPWLLELMSDWSCCTLALYSSGCGLELLSLSVCVSGRGMANRGQRHWWVFVTLLNVNVWLPCVYRLAILFVRISRAIQLMEID